MMLKSLMDECPALWTCALPVLAALSLAGCNIQDLPGFQGPNAEPLPPWRETISLTCDFPEDQRFWSRSNDVYAIRSQQGATEVYQYKSLPANDLRIVDKVRDRSIRLVHANARARLTDATFSPDGRRLAFVTRAGSYQAGEIVELDLDTLDYTIHGHWPGHYEHPLPLEAPGHFLAFESSVSVGGIPPHRTVKEYINRAVFSFTPVLITPRGSWYLNHEAETARGRVVWSDEINSVADLAPLNPEVFSHEIGWRPETFTVEDRRQKITDVELGPSMAFYWEGRPWIYVLSLDDRLAGFLNYFRMDFNMSQGGFPVVDIIEVTPEELISSYKNRIPLPETPPSVDETLCLTGGQFMQVSPYDGVVNAE